MPQKREYKDNVGKAVVGGSVGGLGYLLRQDPKFKDLFIDKINRADFISRNWQGQRPDSDGLIHYNKNKPFSAFSEADPRLTQAFLDEGTSGVRRIAGEVWQDNIATERRPWIRADISGAGDFKKALKNLKSITTVTPDASSARFGGTDAPPVGGAVSETLWGNPTRPRYSYAKGNVGSLGGQVIQMEGVGQIRNPSAHFSGVDLPASEQTEYLYTGGSQKINPKERGWGISKEGTGRINTKFDGGSDVHFGREHRKVAGLTTANDLYTYISDQGFQPPQPTSDPGEYLKELTDQVRKLSYENEGYKYDRTPSGVTKTLIPDNEILLNHASLQPTSGPTVRETGQLPIQSKLDWKNSSQKAVKRAGDGSFFRRMDLLEAGTAPINPSWVQPPIDTNVEMKFEPSTEAAGKRGFKPNYRNVGQNLANRFAPGAIATSIVSPEVADDIHRGDYLSAGGKAAGAFGTGELIAGGTNFLLDKASRFAPYLPGTINNLSTIAAPAAVGISSIDAFSTLASGKNVRELAVETGNVGPALQAMSMPRTMAPLGGAGAVSQSVGMQATVPNLYPERKKESEAGDKRVNEARKRGGRFRFAGLSLPEFGFSEGLGIN